MRRPRRAAPPVPVVVPLAIVLIAGGAVAWQARDAGARQPGPFRYVAAPAAVFEGAADRPLQMPSDVAVAPDGRVFVADGVNNRIVAFHPGGAVMRELTSAGETPLSRPLGVDAQADGTLWIADTGNARIVAVAADGALLHEFAIPPNGETPADVTDVAVDVDGRRVWFTDNDADQVGYVDTASGAVTRLGGSGESLGQFRYPYGLAPGADGLVFVAEALNGRVQVARADGQPAGRIGSYGVRLGELYRPKGITLSADGAVWVSDARIGVVQVFRPSGECLDVLRDEEGEPFRFDAPAGLDFGPDGSLYVVELAHSRVVKLTISGDATVPPVSAAPERQTNQPRTCTACHVEWLSPLVEGKATAIFAPPPNPPAHPAVSRSENCLSCHDGTIVDSRRAVWIEHGHPRGTKPGDDVSVPARLPLVDGGIECRTCHSAHTRGGAGETIATAVFLRVDSEPVELCLSCHSAQAAAGAGNHGLSRIDPPLSATLAAAGAQLSDSGKQMSCLTCHMAHGGQTPELLRLPAGSALCTSCHSMNFSEVPHAQSPLAPAAPGLRPVPAVHPGFSADLDHEALACSECHDMHDAASHGRLLREPLAGSVLCATCHAEQTGVFASAHDLSQTHADHLNRAGLSVAEAGACSACHMVHGEARERFSTPLDPEGSCLDCHAPTGIAAAHALGSRNHPVVGCNECHNPHTPQFEPFLKTPAAELCRSCHADQARLAGGPHDVTQGSADWPDFAREKSACLACHMPHGDDDNRRFRAGLAAGEPAGDAACVACHGEQSSSGGAAAMLHPRKVDAVTAPSHPLTDAGEMKCATCHDPHAGPAPAALLRTPSPDALVCSECHADARHIAITGHAPGRLAAAGYDAEGCRPCHAVHASRATTDPHLLWPNDLRGAVAGAEVATDDAYCVGCHSSAGRAPSPVISSHPAVEMFAAHTGGSALPLFTREGVVAAAGTIHCRTCHVPHGREDAGAAEFPGLMGPWTQVRPFRVPNLCSDCHGADALRRFLYFHDPQRRGTAAGVPGDLRLPASRPGG